MVSEPTATSIPAPTELPVPTSTVAPTETAVSLTGQLLFSSRRIDTNGDGLIQPPDAIHIYQVELANGRIRQLTHTNAYHTSPTWSPDGTQIAYRSTEAGNVDLFVMDADGKNGRQLTSNIGLVSAPSWSPTGTALVFAGGEGTAQLFVVDVATLALTQLTNSAVDLFAPSWSENGRFILYHSPTALHLYDFDTNSTFEIDDALSNGEWLYEDSASFTAQSSSGCRIQFFDLIWEDDQPTIQKGSGCLQETADYVWLSPTELIAVWEQSDSSELMHLDMNDANVSPSNGEQLTHDAYYESNIDWKP